MTSPITGQVTMYIHRVNLPSETPSNGYINDLGSFYDSQTSTKTINAADPTYNAIAVSTGKSLVGIVGLNDWAPAGVTNTVQSMSINFTSPSQVVLSSSGYQGNMIGYAGLFYTVDCDPSCASCSGTGASNCLTCANGSPPANGICAAIICDASCSTCSGPLSTNCVTCPGSLTALSGACTCPAGKYVSSTATNFLCSSCDSSCSTCSGPLSTNCVTCTSGSPSVSGVCTVVCPNGCSACSSSTTCTTCTANVHRFAFPDSSHKCPCISGYYENSSGNCVSCPFSQYCETCELSTGNIACLTCRCANHREVINGFCKCISGYQEDTGSPGPNCLQISVS